jgi:hypothetical protein
VDEGNCEGDSGESVALSGKFIGLPERKIFAEDFFEKKISAKFL